MVHYVTEGGVHEREITLPWPPSVNMVYRSFAFINRAGKPMSRMIISKDGKAYFEMAQELLKGGPTFGDRRLKVVVTAHALDRRKRDLGNLDKVLMDSLQKSGVFDDDEQIDDLRFKRGEICPNKNAHVVIKISVVPKNDGPSCLCPECCKNFTDLFGPATKTP